MRADFAAVEIDAGNELNEQYSFGLTTIKLEFIYVQIVTGYKLQVMNKNGANAFAFIYLTYMF